MSAGHLLEKSTFSWASSATFALPESQVRSAMCHLTQTLSNRAQHSMHSSLSVWHQYVIACSSSWMHACMVCKQPCACRCSTDPLLLWDESLHAREPARLHMTDFVAHGSSAAAQAAAPVAKPFCAASPEERSQVLKALRESGEGHHAYTCPKGHLFLVGNCGSPCVAARCPDCGASIGAGSFCPNASLS